MEVSYPDLCPKSIIPNLLLRSYHCCFSFNFFFNSNVLSSLACLLVLLAIYFFICFSSYSAPCFTYYYYSSSPFLLPLYPSPRYYNVCHALKNISLGLPYFHSLCSAFSLEIFALGIVSLVSWENCILFLFVSFFLPKNQFRLLKYLPPDWNIVCNILYLKILKIILINWKLFHHESFNITLILEIYINTTYLLMSKQGNVYCIKHSFLFYAVLCFFES